MALISIASRPHFRRPPPPLPLLLYSLQFVYGLIDMANEDESEFVGFILNESVQQRLWTLVRDVRIQADAGFYPERISFQRVILPFLALLTDHRIMSAPVCARIRATLFTLFNHHPFFRLLHRIISELTAKCEF